MKLENFERVKQLVKEIEYRKSLLRDIKSVASSSGGLSVHARMGSLDVYVPVRYETVGQEYLHKIVQTVEAEIQSFTEELDAL